MYLLSLKQESLLCSVRKEKNTYVALNACMCVCMRAHVCARVSDSHGSDELLEMPLLSWMTGAGPQEETSLRGRPLLDGLQAQLGLQVEELTAQLKQVEEESVRQAGVLEGLQV